MNINMEIPAPSTPEKAVPIGYDIPRDTISRDFIKSTRTARQLSSQSAVSDGFRQYLIPSTSSSPTKPACESPRIVFSAPDDDTSFTSLGYHQNPTRAIKSSWADTDPETTLAPVETRRTHNRSLLMAFMVAAFVLIIVIFFIALLIYN